LTIRLRAHHLLCMLTFVGKGYSPRFVENYETIAARLSSGEPIEIVEGPDDICRPLVEKSETPHCLGASVTARDAAALLAVSASMEASLEPGAMLTPSAALVGRLRTHFSTGQLRGACAGCEWSGLCDAVAAGGYARARVRPERCG
jgi:hypothetical protein